MGRISRAAGMLAAAAAALGLALAATTAAAQVLAPAYKPITATMADRTVVLTGKDLTIQQVVDVARHGARVAISPEARQRTQDTFAMFNQGAAEGVPIYLFNRGAGAQREITTFTGDPMSAENRPRLEAQALARFRAGAGSGYGPEFADEATVRAIMLVRLNGATWLPMSPQMLQAMVDLLNAGITPVMRTRSGTGEALGPASGPHNAAMVGAGEVYYRGQKMSAAQALQQAGLRPIQPAPGDTTLGTVNADVSGPSALLVADAEQLLHWIDLAYAVDLNGMNSSLTPLFQPVQSYRPYPWINWTARRLLEMMKGSYLFNAEQRIIQDPESLRAGYVRQGSSWEEWANLRDAVLTQINWSDHNPAAKVNVKPEDSWELSTPQAMKYFVRGGPANGGKSGFVFSNANWDPYPLSNRLEAFTIALANTDVAVMLRQERFRSTFFTVVPESDFPQAGTGLGFNSLGWTNHEVWQHIQGLINPVPPEGYCLDAECVEELDAEGLFKVRRAIEAVHESWMLAASDLITGMRWMDIRKLQDPSRAFGPAPTAAHAAFRQVVPLNPPASAEPVGWAAVEFMKANPVSTFFRTDPPMPEWRGEITGAR